MCCQESRHNIEQLGILSYSVVPSFIGWASFGFQHCRPGFWFDALRRSCDGYWTGSGFLRAKATLFFSTRMMPSGCFVAMVFKAKRDDGP